MPANTPPGVTVASKGAGKSSMIARWFAEKYPTRRSRRGLRIFIVDGKSGNWPGNGRDAGPGNHRQESTPRR